MHWFLIVWASLFVIRFGYQAIADWGKDEATLPIQVIGDTYQRDENPTMYTAAVTGNFIVTIAALAFVIYQVGFLLTPK